MTLKDISSKNIRNFLDWTWSRRSFWIRALLCWLAGVTVLFVMHPDEFDLRFKLRPQQASNPNIIIVDIPERDFRRLKLNSKTDVRALKDSAPLGDQFFWSKPFWSELLNKIIQQSPVSIGVALNFTETQVKANETDSIFQDPKVIWGARIDASGRSVIPDLALPFNSNIGVSSLRADDDGIVRRFSSPLIQIPSLPLRLAQTKLKKKPREPNNFWQSAHLINFRGPRGSFPRIHFQDVLEAPSSSKFFENKVVLIGVSGTANYDLQTPFGKMTRAEILANVYDNIVDYRWIHLTPSVMNMAYLLLLVILFMLVAFYYPQGMSFAFFVLIGTGACAISAYLFDNYNLWFPALAPIILLIITYIVFLSFQLSINEQRNWVLEQEKKYLQEIEQLKHNFVSLFSHDLKTPIAKIQGIVDRVLSKNPSEEIQADLKSLRKSSDELHKYIQNVLNVIRVESSEFKLNAAAVDINDLIEKVITQTRPLALEKNIDISTKLEPMFSVEIDPLLVQEILLNLVENAIKYTKNGGSVFVSSQEVDDYVKVLIKDTGIGISTEDQKQIWGKFNRGQAQNSEIKGTGLGLYLVKYFTELHGGTISMESELGQGTTFILSLPVQNETGAFIPSIAAFGD